MPRVDGLRDVVLHTRPGSRVRDPRRAHVWLCRLEEVSGAEAVLSAEERARALRFRRETDRTRYVARHVLVRSTLAAFVRRPPESLEFRTGRCGKPHLAFRDGRRTEAIDGVDFSVAHSEDVLALAVTPGRAVGVDLEVVRPIPDPLGTAATQFPPAVLRELAGLPPEELEDAFYRLWTRKEALTKMQGRGLDCRHSRRPLGIPRWTLQSFTFGHGRRKLVGALALEDRDERVAGPAEDGPTPSGLPSPWAGAPWSRTSGSGWPAARSARSTACRSS